MSAAFPSSLLSALALCLTLPVQAQSEVGESAPAETRLTWSGALEVGAEHNSNISITELETASNTSDTALMLEASLSAQWRPREQVTVEGGFIYTSRRFDEAKAFDLDITMLYADASYQLKGTDIGANYYFARADLGSRRFLRLDQYSFYTGRLLAERWYLRAAVNQVSKRFEDFQVRDADTRGLGIDSFYFFNQGRSTVIAGYAWEDEDTLGPEFEYRAHALRLRLHQRFTLWQRQARLQLGWRWQGRDYRHPTQVIGRERQDHQRLTDLRLELDLRRWLSLVGRIELGDYDSNLPSAEFRDNRVSLALRASF